MADAIEIENLTFGYQGDIPVVENISWTLSEGQFVAVVGPNGGGKTTLLKLILGLYSPEKGSIKVFGKSPCKALSKIAYVPQNLIYDRQFPINVLDVVLMGLLSELPWYGRFKKEDVEKALAALRKVNLEDQADAAFGDLSGGQRQRALIARALVSEPKLLLLDEPTASVDVKAETDIYRLLAMLQGEMTIIMVTHDLQTAINNIENVVLVQRTLRALSKEEVCQHFAIGLYHPPVAKGKLNVIS
ncbi:MAG: ABC transporter ATP-binding protein [Parachlamydiales bacterium]|jgi:zinc transport system ATP-binding protein